MRESRKEVGLVGRCDRDDGGGIGTDRHEGDVTEGNDPGAPYERLEADDHRRVDPEDKDDFGEGVVGVKRGGDRGERADCDHRTDDRLDESLRTWEAVAVQKRMNHQPSWYREPLRPPGRMTRIATT